MAPVLQVGSASSEVDLWLKVIGVAIALITLWFGAVQIKRAVAAFNSSTLNSAIASLLSDPDVRDNRKALYRKTLSPSPRKLAKESKDEFAARQKKLWSIATLHDRYAMIANTAGPARAAVLYFQLDEVRMTYELLRPFIEHIRRSETRPNYCVDLEELYLYSTRLRFRFYVWKRSMARRLPL